MSSTFSVSMQHKTHFVTRCQWLTPVILTTQEAELMIIMVQSRLPRQIVFETLSRKNPTQKRAGRVAQIAKCLLSKH
jgi:hypothetical protein